MEREVSKVWVVVGLMLRVDVGLLRGVEVEVGRGLVFPTRVNPASPGVEGCRAIEGMGGRCEGNVSRICNISKSDLQ